MGKHLTADQQADVITSYRDNLEPMISIAERYSITRQGVWKLLKRNGIEPAEHEALLISCSACGETFTRPRCRVRASTNNFCSNECYYAFLEAGNGKPYNPSKAGQRFARALVSKYIDLMPGNIVHHEDRNCLNNSVNNLRVFATQGDHVRHHRLGADYATPLWDGSKI